MKPTVSLIKFTTVVTEAALVNAASAVGLPAPRYVIMNSTARLNGLELRGFCTDYRGPFFKVGPTMLACPGYSFTFVPVVSVVASIKFATSI